MLGILIGAFFFVFFTDVSVSKLCVFLGLRLSSSC